MKNLKFLISVTFFAFLTASSFEISAKGTQPEKVEVNSVKLLGLAFTLDGYGIELTTPSSNFLKTYKFRLSDEDLAAIDFEGLANCLVILEFEYGDDELLYGAGFINKAGVLNFVILKNGSGGLFPRGWLSWLEA